MFLKKVLSKNQRALSNRKNPKCLEFESGCNVWQNTPQLTKLCRVTLGAIREGAKIRFKIPYLIGRQILSKKQRAPSNKEKL